jgi:DNA-binding transcriptional LysR family regulator
MSLATVNIRRFAYWLAVVDEGSFTRAARALQIAQPSLSQQVRALEAEVGGALIERLPGAIRLTPAGKAFLPEARAAVLGAERAVRSARAALKIESGELEIATVRSIAVGLLPPSIRMWHDAYPGVTVRLYEYAHRDLLAAAVRSGIGDIAIGPRPDDWSGPLVSLGWEEFLLVLPLADPLAAKKTVPIESLREHRWVLFPPEHGLSELVNALCGRAGYLPREAVRTSQVEAAARLAAAGIGPALVPDNMVPSDLDAAVRRADPPVIRELVAYTRNEWSPSARRYRDIVHALPWRKPPRGAIAIS